MPLVFPGMAEALAARLASQRALPFSRSFWRVSSEQVLLAGARVTGDFLYFYCCGRIVHGCGLLSR